MSKMIVTFPFQNIGEMAMIETMLSSIQIDLDLSASKYISLVLSL